MKNIIRSYSSRTISRHIISFLLVISVLLCIPATIPSAKAAVEEPAVGYTAKITIKTINDADGWNSAWMKLYAKRDHGTGGEFEVWNWQSIKSQIDDSNETFTGEIFCPDNAFPSRVEIYTDFGGGATFRKWEGEVTIYVNGVNVKKENITSNSGFFTSSNDTNNVSIDGLYYPFPRKIEVLTYEKSVLPEGDDFGRLYQKAGTDKCEGLAFVNVLDQYNVSWLRNHDTIVSGTAHSHDKVYTYDTAENLTSPDTDSWEKGGYAFGKNRYGQLLTLNSTSGIDHQSQYRLTFRTGNYLFPVITRTFDVYFVFRHKVRVLMGDTELLGADDFSGKWVDIDPSKFRNIPAGYKVTSLTKTSGAGRLDKNDNGKYQFTFSISDAVVSAETEPISYRILFDGNGGTGNINFMNMTYDKTARLPSNAFVYTGKHFTGWNTRADGKGTAYENREFVKNLTSAENGSVTLYAQWAENIYTVGLVYPDEIMSLPDGLKPGTTQVNVKHGGSISVPEVIKSDNPDGHYRFVSADSSLEKITSDAEIELKYEKTAHSFGAAVITKAPDCTHKGEQIRICEECGYEEITELPEEHQGLTVTPEKLPTCTEPGHTETKYCEICKKWIEKGDEIPATGHDYDEPQWEWNDDFSTAEATFVCKNCGEVSTVKTDSKNDITVIDEDDDIDYIATISFNGKTYTGKFIHDNANMMDSSSMIGSAFGNGSVIVLIMIAVLAVIITIIFIVLKKKKILKDDEKSDSE